MAETDLLRQLEPVLEVIAELDPSDPNAAHRLQELFRLADRVLALDFGKKIMEGRPEDVLQDDAVRSAYLGPEEAAWH